MKHVIGALLLSLALPQAFADESPAAAFFGRLAGHWQGAGVVSEMAADMRMNWEPVLDGRFQRLTMDNRMTGTEGKTWHFMAHAYYRIEPDGTIAGTWFDSRSFSLPLAGSVNGNLMTIQWGTEGVERGRSSYRLTAEGLEVVDEVLTKEGDWRTFGRTLLARADTP